jgi:uncharacterized protein YjbK
MIVKETVTQEILVRLQDGVVLGAMVTEQDLYIDDEDYSLVGRSALKIRDMDAEAIQVIADMLGHEYVEYISPDIHEEKIYSSVTPILKGDK